MTTLEFILDMTRALAWPMAVVLAVNSLSVSFSWRRGQQP